MTATQAASNARLVGGPVRLRGWSLSDGIAPGGITADASVIAPVAGATIASVSLPTLVYQVAWSLQLSGTPGAADANNVQALLGAALQATSVNQGAAGIYGQEEFQLTVTGGPLLLAFKAINNAVAGSAYTIEANITPIGSSAATVMDGAQPLGFSVMPPGGGDTHWFSGDGVEVLSQLSVQATLGAPQGVLWYDMCYADDS